MNSESVLRLALLLGLGASAVVARASTNGFYVPSIREDAGTRTSYWENFTVPVGSPGNLPNFGNDLTSVLTQSVAGAIIAGGAAGNIYNMPAASQFSISYSGSVPIGHVVFQARTAGTELDYSTVQLNYASGSLTAARTELDRLQFGTPGVPGPQGFFVSSSWEWDLSGLNVSSYSISFKAAEPSLSFDSATLDTQAVPEPSTWALLVLGGLGLGTLHFRSRSSRVR